MKEQLWRNILSVRTQSPLVHNITNYVVMNNTANALLAIGASPVMAHAQSEVKDMAGIAAALVVNIGTLDEYWVKSMQLAVEEVTSSGKPWVLDPVGAGATSYRNKVLSQLIELKPTVIRGNASEIMALSNYSVSTTKGVDSTHESTEAIAAARRLQAYSGSIICISGATDIIISQDHTLTLSNGHPLMGKVTGLGCTASAMIGAFLAVLPGKAMEATAAAMALLSIAGEIAAANAKGPGSLQMHLTDKLYNITEYEFKTLLKTGGTHAL
ncbi:hydroxyethylthiazole kinase [Pedobacter sp. AW31-3R]|uniref:hydroxyethylthiazole kinase n=1 Tax=Pedobacter sp. AW31-3R TaxID=3445781 RepID=UPI003FA01609